MFRANFRCRHFYAVSIAVCTVAASAAMPSGLVAQAVSQTSPADVIDELRLGVLNHDTPGLWSGFRSERAAADVNVEAFFRPLASAFGGYLRPSVGATINTRGDTSKAYADLHWEYTARNGLFAGIGLGAAFHNGAVTFVNASHKSLGSQLLFHPSLEIGYRFDEVNSISIYFDHMSNGNITRINEGMDTLGVRLGRRFDKPGKREQIEVDDAERGFSGPYAGLAGQYQAGTADWYWFGGGQQITGATRPAARFAGVAGYNFRSGNGVFGLEASVEPGRQKFAVPCHFGAASCELTVGTIYSPSARFGWVFGKTMPFFSAGIAVANWNATVAGALNGRSSASHIATKVAIGVEQLISDDISLRAEVLHYGFQSSTVPLNFGGWDNAQFRSTTGRLGLSWYFK